MHSYEKSTSHRRIMPLSSSVLLVVAVAAFLLLVGPVTYGAALAKRFDCELFCRTTGFHGNVGGCRCSFTLFTSKRSRLNAGDDDLRGAVDDGDYSSVGGRLSASNTLDDLTRVPRDQQDRFVRM